MCEKMVYDEKLGVRICVSVYFAQPITCWTAFSTANGDRCAIARERECVRLEDLEHECWFSLVVSGETDIAWIAKKFQKILSITHMHPLHWQSECAHDVHGPTYVCGTNTLSAAYTHASRRLYAFAFLFILNMDFASYALKSSWLKGYHFWVSCCVCASCDQCTWRYIWISAGARAFP